MLFRSAEFFFTGNIVSITGEGDYFKTTVDGIEVPNNSPPALVLAAGEREVHILGDKNVTKKDIKFKIVVTGKIKLGEAASGGNDFISPDGTTVNAGVHRGNRDGFIFSGDIVSISADNLIRAYLDNYTDRGIILPFTLTSLSPTELSNIDEVQETVSKVSEIKSEQIQETVTEVQGNGTSSGGCLIATATFGTELAPQVQQLRELRDNTLLQTKSGSAFMNGFNEFYYSFSPTIADWERQNPIFKEAMKLSITPLLTSLSILNYVNMDSEAEVLGFGMSVIALNIGMYFVAPVIVITRFRKKSS